MNKKQKAKKKTKKRTSSVLMLSEIGKGEFSERGIGESGVDGDPRNAFTGCTVR